GKKTQPAPQRSQAPSQANSRVNPRDGSRYVWVPPGSFLMGCSPGDDGCSDRERPAHRVTITKGFWMGQTEVTQIAWVKLMGRNPSLYQGDELPVEQVTWDEARQYCESASMRLPSEPEWEWAARGGTTAARYGKSDAIAWHSYHTSQEQPVGKKA